MIRPLPGAKATARRFREAGWRVLVHPLFAIEPLEWQPGDARRHDAILFGSANALRHGGPNLRALVGLPAMCVGAATAQAARKAGFEVIATGTGGLQSLVPEAVARSFHRLLRISGESHVPLELPHDMSLETRVAYRVAAKPFDAALSERLRHGATVLLHSGDAAAHFAAQCDANDCARDAIGLACLAPRIAEAAGDGWRTVAVAERPDDAALLACARQLCQGDRQG